MAGCAALLPPYMFSAELRRDGADPEADAQVRRDVAAAQLAKIAAMLG